jgi:hypothetical protein
MKKASIVKCMAILIGSALPFIGFAQNPGGSAALVTQDIALQVNGSALLAVYNTNASAGTNTAVSMSLSGATQAGAAVMDQATNSDTRLRISSLVESGKTRTITASIAPAITTSGTQFFVTLTKPETFQPAVANGGNPSTEQELTDGSSKTIVTDITTCWSGMGNADGYTVTYRYAKKADATFLQSQNIIITYTITAAV